ncbi:glycosyltransferase family 4 protein [Patescibacteria group bacterium]|nr:glycosyltransferase family 4 protein [Patescibacteria group bacterium]
MSFQNNLSKLKIAHLICSFPPYQGGMGNVCLEQAKELARQGHRVTVFTPQYRKEIKSQEKMFGFRVERLVPIWHFGNAAFLSGLRKKLETFDIIHLHWPFIGTGELILFSSSIKSRLIVQYHMDLIDRGWRGFIFQLYNYFFNKKMVKVAQKILVSSSSYLENSFLKKWAKIYSDKFIISPFGVHQQRFFPQKKDDALLKKHQIKKGKPVLLFVGGLDRAHYFKGVPVLLKALARKELREISPCLVLVGDGDLRKDYQQLSQKLGLSSSQIIFAGRISDELLPKYYQLADVFILPSISSSEAFGLVSLEAMASAKPIIVSDLPGPNSLVEGNGFLFPKGNDQQLAQKIKILIKDQNLRKALGEKSKRLVEEKYNWPQITKNLEKLYYEILN